MADNNDEEIRIGADITELKSQLRAAQDELRSFNKEIERANAMITASGGQATGNNSLLKIYEQQAEGAKDKIVGLTNSLAQARTALAALESGSSVTFKTLQEGVDSSLRLDTALNSAAASAKVFKTSMSAVAATDETLRVTGAAAEVAAGGMKDLNFFTSGAIQEYIRLGHEAMTGNFSRMPGSAIVLTSRMGGLSLATLGTYGAFALLAAGVGYAIYKFLDFEREIDHLTEGFALTGRGADFTSEAIRYQINFLDTLPGVTRKAAEALMQYAAEHANISSQMLDQTSQLLPAFVKLYGEKAPEAVGKLTETLSHLTVEGFHKLDEELLNLPIDQYEVIENMIKTGQEAQAVEIILHSLANNGGVYIKSLGDKVYDTLQQMEKMKAVLNSGGEASTWAAQEVLRLQEQLDLLRQKEKLAGQQTSANQYKREHDELVKLDEELNKRGAIVARIAELQRHRDTASKRKDGGEVFLADQAIAAEQQKLTDLGIQQSDKLYTTFVKNEDAKAAAFKSGSKQRIQIAQEELDHALAMFGDNSNQYADALRKLNDQKRAASEVASRDAARQQKLDASEAIQDASTASRTIISDQSITSARKLELVRQVWDQLKAGEKLTQQELLRIRKEEEGQELEIERQRVALVRQARTEQLNTDLQMEKLLLQEKRSALDEEVAYFQITKDQKSHLLKQYTEEEYAAEIQNIQQLMQLDGVSLAEKTKYTQQIILLKEKERAALAQLDQQEAVNAVNTWKSTLQPIQQATISMFSTMGTAGKSFGQVMLGVTGNLIDSFLAARIKIEFDWLAGQLAMAFGAQDGAEKSLLAWIATQLGITTASDTAAANKVATDQATALSSAATSKSVSAGEIMDSAAVAAAATFASIAAIPIIGPGLAPGAAAASFGTVSAMTSLLAVPLAVGAYDVPQDMLAQIHKGETVVPKTFAQGMRENGGFGRGGGDTHVHFSPTFQSLDPVTGAKYMQTMMPTIAKQLKTYLKYNLSMVPQR